MEVATNVPPDAGAWLVSARDLRFNIELILQASGTSVCRTDDFDMCNRQQNVRTALDLSTALRGNIPVL
jgi:hypothetical protein